MHTTTLLMVQHKCCTRQRCNCVLALADHLCQESYPTERYSPCNTCNSLPSTPNSKRGHELQRLHGNHNQSSNSTHSQQLQATHNKPRQQSHQTHPAGEILFISSMYAGLVSLLKAMSTALLLDTILPHPRLPHNGLSPGAQQPPLQKLCGTLFI